MDAIPAAGDPAPIPTARVVLADDHAVVREGLKALINAQPDMTVIGEAADGAEACELAGELLPDVIVMDLSMNGMSGIDATERIIRQWEGIKVLALTVHAEPSYVTQFLRAGASGYVLKRAAPEELVRAVRCVAAGGAYIDPHVAGTIVQGYLDRPSRPDSSSDTLSERERDVLVRIARGFTNKEIARDLMLSVKTVETYKARVAEKLGLRSRVEIVRYASARGWLWDADLAAG